MLRKRRINKSQSIAIKCLVDNQSLLKVVEKVSGIEFFKLNQNDELIKLFGKLGIRSVSKISGDDCIDVVVSVDRNTFNNLLGVLIKCDAEVVVIYFPNDAIHFDKFLHNKRTCNNPQKEVVENGLCALICTWVTNEDKLYFEFDSSKYNNESISQII